MLQGFRGVCPARGGDWETRSMQAADTRHLFLGVCNFASVYRLLSLEHCIDTLRRYDDLILVVENEGRVLPIEHDYIDLFTEGVVAVNDMGPVGPIAPRQITLEQFNPDPLTRISL